MVPRIGAEDYPIPLPPSRPLLRDFDLPAVPRLATNSDADLPRAPDTPKEDIRDCDRADQLEWIHRFRNFRLVLRGDTWERIGEC